MTTYTVLTETTKWDCDGNIPNHAYILDSNDKCVGYIKEGTTTPIKFSKPMAFDRRYRKFKTQTKVHVDFETKSQDSSNNIEAEHSNRIVRPITSNSRGKTSMSKSKTLNWNDRFALIDYYNPTDTEACTIFGVSRDELNTARNMRRTGVIVPTDNIDVSSYGKMFGVTSNIKPSSNPETKTVTNMKSTETTSTSTSKPQTATKKQKQLKKRGRKGTNILEAFRAVPSTPTSVEEFAQKHSVSIAVLRQAKRFDATECEGTVHVKKDKKTKTLVIWRSAEE